MHIPFYTLPVVGISLEGLLIWRLLKKRLLNEYPYFSVWVLYDFLRCFVLFAMTRFWWESYGLIYWCTETVSLFLRFLIIWELVRSVFPANSIFRQLAWKLLACVELALLPLMLVLSLGESSALHYFYTYLSPTLEQYLSLAQAILLLVPVAVARYYRVPLGRNLRGLVFGFGAYLSVCAAGFASLQAWPRFFVSWHFLSPVSYIAMTVVWLWAFWEYAPSTRLARLTTYNCVPWAGDWHHLWGTTMKLLRRSLG